MEKKLLHLFMSLGKQIMRTHLKIDLNFPLSPCLGIPKSCYAESVPATFAFHLCNRLL